MDTLIFPAFLAGLLTFLAPCTLPLVPAYLGFISGVYSGRQASRKIFLNGLFFVLGFGLIFILFGTLAGFIGQTLGLYRIWLGRIGGIFVIIFGLFMLNAIKIPFLSIEKRLPAPRIFERGKPLNSMILGSAFAFGWTPCIGPILGSILLLASTTATAFKGALLLAIFSAGLAVPFLIIAWGIDSAAEWIGRIGKFLNVISILGGLLLVLLGILLLTDNMTFLISWGYRIFNFINYDRLLEYL